MSATAYLVLYAYLAETLGTGTLNPLPEDEPGGLFYGTLLGLKKKLKQDREYRTHYRRSNACTGYLCLPSIGTILAYYSPVLHGINLKYCTSTDLKLSNMLPYYAVSVGSQSHACTLLVPRQYHIIT